MKRGTLEKVEMLGKVAGFGKTIQGKLTTDSLALTSFKTIDASRLTISSLGALPRHGKRPGTESREAARGVLAANLDAVRTTMLAVAIDHPGIGVNFKLPQGRRQDQQLIRAAQEFIKHSTPL